MGITVGLNQSAIQQARTEEFLVGCGSNGINEVELRVPKITEALYHLSKEEFQSVLDESGVQVAAVNSMDDFALVPDDNLKILEREAETVRDLCIASRCELVVAPVGRWFSETKPEWEWVRDRSASRLARIGKIFADGGIKVGLEPIAFPFFSVWSLEESMEIIEASGRIDVVLVADVYNLMQGQSDENSMRRYGDSIGLIHVNDANHRNYDQMDVMYTRCYPGEGVLNPGDWVRSAVEGGFTGRVSMEVFPKNLWEMDIDESLKLCRVKARIFEESLA